MIHRHSRHATRRAARRAFTLLEVIVAVTIVAILAALLVPNVMRWVGRSKTQVAKSGVAVLANQVRLWCADHEMSSPPNDFVLAELREGENPYLENDNQLLDPWGNPYAVFIPGVVNKYFDIVSYGRDGQEGGEGEDEDVINGAQDKTPIERKGAGGK